MAYSSRYTCGTDTIMAAWCPENTLIIKHVHAFRYNFLPEGASNKRFLDYFNNVSFYILRLPELPNLFLNIIFTIIDSHELTVVRHDLKVSHHCHIYTVPRVYWKRKLITMSTTGSYWDLFRGSWIQSTASHPIALRSILILSSHLHIGFLRYSLERLWRLKYKKTSIQNALVHDLFQ
jgi:hypothetical protein